MPPVRADALEAASIDDAQPSAQGAAAPADVAVLRELVVGLLEALGRGRKAGLVLRFMHSKHSARLLLLLARIPWAPELLLLATLGLEWMRAADEEQAHPPAPPVQGVAAGQPAQVLHFAPRSSSGELREPLRAEAGPTLVRCEKCNTLKTNGAACMACALEVKP